MDYFELLKYRKSTRKFAPGQISPEELGKILLAGSGAPVGSAQYKDVHLTVCTSGEILSKLAEAAEKRWEDTRKMKEILGETKLESALPKKGYDPFYGAPTVIFISHRAQTLQPGIEFSNVACVAYSMHLAATALGLGSVFMWFALESMRELPELDHTGLLALPEGFAPLLGLAVGKPASPPAPREIKTDRMTVNYV